MGYFDRLRTARYRSPGGSEIRFDFRELQRGAGHKGAVHEAPQQDDAIVQDLGVSALRFSIEATIHGPDYDLRADAFFDSLRESGFGLLLHPRWGDIAVLPLTFLQREAFVDGAGAAVFDIEFVRVPDVQYPITTTQAEAAIAEGADAASEATGEQVGAGIAPESAAEAAAVKKGLREQVADFRGRMTTTLARAGNVATEFERAVTEFEETLDALILTPIALAEAYLAMVRGVALAVVSIPSKVAGYIGSITTLYDSALETGASVAEAASRSLQVLAALIGLAESCIEGELVSRTDALGVVDALRAGLEEALASVEADEAATGYVAPASVVSQARALIAMAQALMLERSFGLAVERRLVLIEDRTPLDLVYELYGDIERLDEFIDHNRLTDDELFLIPRGREVRYYAE